MRKHQNLSVTYSVVLNTTMTETKTCLRSEFTETKTLRVEAESRLRPKQAEIKTVKISRKIYDRVEQLKSTLSLILVLF